MAGPCPELKSYRHMCAEDGKEFTALDGLTLQAGG